MNLFDFITQEEIDDLPDDPPLAFMAFVRQAERRFAQRAEELNSREEGDWHLLEDARYSFQNVIVAAGKRFGIQPFSSMSIPRFDEYNKKGDDYRQFKSDLDFYMTQLVIDSRIRNGKDSVFISVDVKEKIRRYIHGLRVTIDQSGLNDSKRAALHEKLSEFERELDKKRLNLSSVTRIAFVILALPGSMGATYDVTAKLINNIMQTVAEAKVVDDEGRQLPPVEKPAALLPPRQVDKISSNVSDNLDDEIPF